MTVDVFIFLLNLRVCQTFALLFDLDIEQFDVGLEFFNPQIAQSDHILIFHLQGFQFFHRITVQIDIALVNFDGQFVFLRLVFRLAEFGNLLPHFVGIQISGTLYADFFNCFQQHQGIGFERRIFVFIACCGSGGMSPACGSGFWSCRRCGNS